MIAMEPFSFWTFNFGWNFNELTPDVLPRTLPWFAMVSVEFVYTIKDVQSRHRVITRYFAEQKRW